MSNLIFTVLVFVVFLELVICWVAQTHNINNEIGNEVTEDNTGEQRLSLIVPGTKWCGSGNISEGYDDLGRFEDTDKCCRTHDYCDDVIEAGKTKNNLTNTSFYTRLNCKCDEDFYNCLRTTESSVSNHVGAVYFNILGTKCYREDYPIKSCIKKQKNRCIEYEFDENGNKQYQWFDVPLY